MLVQSLVAQQKLELCDSHLYTTDEYYRTPNNIKHSKNELIGYVDVNISQKKINEANGYVLVVEVFG